MQQPFLIPVYTDLNSIHQVQLFRQSDDGTFRRTGVEPLRMLRENITGISYNKGELISSHFDRDEHKWSSPTVRVNAVQCQSYYRYLHRTLPRNQLMVAVPSSMYGRLFRFAVHELTFKPGISKAILRLIRERYTDALDLWSEDCLKGEFLTQQSAR